MVDYVCRVAGQVERLPGGREDTVVVSGWFNPETLGRMLSKRLETDKLPCAVGSLYSNSLGVLYVVGNLLSNPQVKRVFLLSATPQDAIAGSIAVLESVLVDQDVTKLRPDLAARIPEEAFREFDQLVIQRFHSVDDLVTALNEPILTVTPRKVARRLTPLHPPKKSDANSYPDSLGVFTAPTVISANDVSDCHKRAVLACLSQGIDVIAVTRPYRTIQNLITVSQVRYPHNPDFYSSQADSPVSYEVVKAYADTLINPSKHEGVEYTYGDRIFPRLEGVIESLRQDSSTRRAYLSLWEDGDNASKNPPCLVSLRFSIPPTTSILSCTAVFRSQDIGSAYHLNVLGLYHLVGTVADRLPELVSGVGSLTTISQDAHVYLDDLPNTLLYTDDTNQVFFQDSLSFTFSVSTASDRKAVDVIVYTDSGDYIRTHPSIPVSKLPQVLTRNYPSLSPSHWLYLGAEIQRLEDYLKGKSSSYKQL
jgi:hypothetical protein